MDGSQNAPEVGAAQRTAAAGLRPPPLGSYRGRVLHRQRFPPSPKGGKGAEMARKVLMRLNFRGAPGIG